MRRALRGSVRRELESSAPRKRATLEFDVQRSAALLEIAEVVSRRREPADLFRDLAPHLRAIVPFDFLNFARFDPARNVTQMYVWEGAEWPREPMEIEAVGAAVGSVWRNQAVLFYQ